MKDASQGEAVYVCHVPSSVKAASFPASQIPACTWSQGNVMSLSDKAQEAVTHLSSRRKVAHAWLTLTAWYLTSVFKLEEFFSMLWSTLQAFTKLHGTSHTTSFWQTQKLKFTKYLQSWQKQEVALCWLDTGGHWLSFLPPCLQQDVLSRDAQHALLARLTCRSSKGQQAVLQLHCQVRSLCALFTEMGRTETLDQLPEPHLQAAGRCMRALPLPSHPSHSHMFSQVCRAGTKITLFMSTKLTQPSTLGIIRHRCVISWGKPQTCVNNCCTTAAKGSASKISNFAVVTNCLFASEALFLPFLLIVGCVFVCFPAAPLKLGQEFCLSEGFFYESHWIPRCLALYFIFMSLESHSPFSECCASEDIALECCAVHSGAAEPGISTDPAVPAVFSALWLR